MGFPEFRGRRSRKKGALRRPIIEKTLSLEAVGGPHSKGARCADELRNEGGVRRVVNLSGGIDAWSQHIQESRHLY